MRVGVKVDYTKGDVCRLNRGKVTTAQKRRNSSETLLAYYTSSPCDVRALIRDQFGEKKL